MTRAEYNEFRYIRSTCHKYGMPTYGCQYTIPTDASPDYKARLDELYRSWNMHPASVRVDTHWFDDRERIVYIYGQTWQDSEGRDRSWTELYSAEERERFAAALR